MNNNAPTERGAVQAALGIRDARSSFRVVDDPTGAAGKRYGVRGDLSVARCHRRAFFDQMAGMPFPSTEKSRTRGSNTTAG